MERGKQIGNSKNQGKHNTSGNYDIYSKAPYNFVPLNEKVVSAETIPDFDMYHSDRYTGYIDIEIEALTPLYIRDTLTEEEYKEKIKFEKGKKQYINHDFFSPGGLPRIPGSSLRGMIRTLVEIMSFGKFGAFDDARLYYRGLADRCKNLREEYTTKIKQKSAGILFKSGLNYYIKPAKGFRQILKGEARRLIEKEGYTYEEFKTYKVKKGYIVVSGSIGGKKKEWFIEFPDNNVKEQTNVKSKNIISIDINEEDILSYRNDKNRDKRVPDLLTLAKDGVPCFYVKYKDKKGKERISFGHTGFFRLAYEKTIGDHIPSLLKNQNIIDIAEAIFGNEKTHSSRVFFEDAYLSENPNKVIYPPTIPKILSGPKPTCFQHYIEQKAQNLNEHPKNLAHYNSGNLIRGYKIYWHRSGKNWIETDNKNIEKHATQYTRIRPVKEGSKFYGRIRFENLSKVELGALLFALKLNDDLAHKIGMGKPLGLGSIKIKPKLYLSDREKRYTDLTKEWDGMKDETQRISEFKNAFEKYVLKSLNENKQSLWDLDRMKQLKKMLDFKNKPADEKTEYLKLEKFRERKVLPNPTEIK